jgi:uncharacterized protein YbjT (DUF2867 family)
MYVILGASGNTGSVVAQNLLAKGERVRALGRSKERLAKLAKYGAETLEGDATNAAFLTRAFEGARAVYFLVPPDFTSNDYRKHQRELVEAGAKAFEASRVHYAVVLSSFGADQASGTGPVAGLHDMEERLGRIETLNALYLRPGYFMENVLPQVSVIQNFGMVATPVRGDLRMPVIATEDIGTAATETLLKLDFAGHQARELHGQRDLSYEEMTRIVGAGIGKPDLNYAQLSGEQFVPAIMQMGGSRNMAELIVEMAGALNDGRMRTLEPRTEANTTATSFETFVEKMFAPAFRAGKAATA